MTNKIVELTQEICELDAEIHHATITGDKIKLTYLMRQSEELKEKVTKYYREVLKQEAELWSI